MNTRSISHESKKAVVYLPYVKLPKPLTSLKEREALAKVLGSLVALGGNAIAPIMMDAYQTNKQIGFVWVVDKYKNWGLEFISFKNENGIVTDTCFLSFNGNKTILDDMCQRLATRYEGQVIFKPTIFSL